MRNTRNVAGRNLRGILLLSSKSRVEELTVSDVKEIQYHPISEEEMWRVLVIKEMLEMKSGEIKILLSWSMNEIEDMLPVQANIFMYQLSTYLNRLKASLI